MKYETCYQCKYFGQSSRLDTEIGQQNVPACFYGDTPKETNALSPICNKAHFERAQR